MKYRYHWIGFFNFLARDASINTTLKAVVVMFVRLSVCLSGTSVHCDHTVHVSVNLSLSLDSPMFCAP